VAVDEVGRQCNNQDNAKSGQASIGLMLTAVSLALDDSRNS